MIINKNLNIFLKTIILLNLIILSSFMVFSTGSLTIGKTYYIEPVSVDKCFSQGNKLLNCDILNKKTQWKVISNDYLQNLNNNQMINIINIDKNKIFIFINSDRYLKYDVNSGITMSVSKTSKDRDNYWRVVEINNDNTYIIKSKLNNKCLDLHYPHKNYNGGKIQLWDCWNGNNQQWLITNIN